MRTTLHLVAVADLRDAGVDFAAAKRSALDHRGGYVSAILGSRLRVAEASFAFAREEDADAFLAAVMPAADQALD